MRFPSILAHKIFDRNAFIGVRCIHHGIPGTISGIDRHLLIVKFDKDFRGTTGLKRTAHIIWPDYIDLDGSLIQAIQNAPDDQESIDRQAEIDRRSFYDDWHGLNPPDAISDDFEYEMNSDNYDERKLIEQDLSEYNDASAQSNEGGWFYDADR